MTEQASGSDARTIVNAMSIDVEDYFQVQAFAGCVSREDWDGFPSRVERNTSLALDIYGETGTKATFFTLGWVAERFPKLVRRIVDEGHELASHGWAHHLVTDQNPEEFRDDIRRTKAILEDTSGRPVTGYRAATFSIGRRNLWAFDVLAEEGYVYSSSVYPIAHDLYGMPEAPRFAFQPTEAPIRELPMTTLRLAGRNLPCSGGGYFRLLPYVVSRQAMRRVNRGDNRPCIFYYHPWELDPDQPRLDGLSAKSRFRHYLNLDKMEQRLRRLLSDFSWGRLDHVFRNEVEPAVSRG